MRINKGLVFLCVSIIMSLTLTSCGIFYLGSTVSGSMIVESIGDPASLSKGMPIKGSGARGARILPPANIGYIISGTPEYLKVTLQKVAVVVSGTALPVTVWSGSQELTINGSGAVDTSAIDISGIPTGTITQVQTTFDNMGKIKGTVTGTLGIGGGASASMTLSTKAAYPYNTISHSGGADSYTAFQAAGSEETDVYLGGNSGGAEVDTPTSIDILAGDTPKLTILVDMSRMLRFYDGCGTGVNPSDPANKAYFFNYTVFAPSIAVFFGSADSIQGYQTNYLSYASEANRQSGTNPNVVQGWMTLVLDNAGSILAGHLVGDNDNDMTVAKGAITTATTTNGATEFTYVIGGTNGDLVSFNAHGFAEQSTVGNSTSITWEGPISSGSTTPQYYGTATLLLRLSANAATLQ